MTYHYHGIDAEESILIKSLPNLGTWALPNLFFIIYREMVYAKMFYGGSGMVLFFAGMASPSTRVLITTL